MLLGWRSSKIKHERNAFFEVTSRSSTVTLTEARPTRRCSISRLAAKILAIARGMMPGLAASPIMVCVFPLFVCAHANSTKTPRKCEERVRKRYKLHVTPDGSAERDAPDRKLWAGQK